MIRPAVAMIRTYCEARQGFSLTRGVVTSSGLLDVVDGGGRSLRALPNMSEDPLRMAGHRSGLEGHESRRTLRRP